MIKSEQVEIIDIPLKMGGVMKKIILSNDKMRATFYNHGARWVGAEVPDKHGELANVVLGVDDLDLVVAEDPGYFGPVIGPVAGRIAAATFNGIELDANEGHNHLHGGRHGWSTQFFDVTTSENIVTFSLIDTQSGYPGPIHIQVDYELRGLSVINRIRISSEQDTYVNPTVHAYFNLTGDNTKTIRDHILLMNSDAKMALDAEKIPTGELVSTLGTPYQFRDQQTIGQHLDEIGTEIDDVFVIDQERATGIELTLRAPESGRQLDIETQREAFVLYSSTGIPFSGQVNGAPMSNERGLVIEPQGLSDKDNHPHFGTNLLPANETVEFETTYHFSVTTDS
jgi:aldose 1-epimerase